MKLFFTAIFVTVFSGCVLAQSVPEPTMPPEFKSDKCSLFPDGDYGECCVEHDKAYYFGGTSTERKAADKQLRSCVRSKGKGVKRKWLANIMYIGVRIGGVSFLPTPFRWGFGNKWPRSRRQDPNPKPVGH